ncbi:MAG: hypothetical protein KDJ15_07985 [Alphaproteobacteria bacterium]|nr:hypothetical protein [Alphaproteobacteria bacterium]
MIEDILTNDWFLYVLGGFAANGFVTQAVALTPTKKDDKALWIAQVVIKALTGTFTMQKTK